ncbi:50S ribosomal protein L37e [Candidatus Woesearchaeota archaeon]|nr:50S ribosomal protein L37e [Candidatus Woesearchaeota archaeon]
MSKGTASMGVRSGKKTHLYCRRCGKHTFHKRKKRCASCGYGKTSKVRSYTWQKKKTLKRVRKQ